MDVAVDQPGNDEAAGEVDAARGCRLRGEAARRADGDDPFAVDQYVLSRARWAPVPSITVAPL